MNGESGNRRIDIYPYKYAGESLDFEIVKYDLDDGDETEVEDPLHLDLRGEVWSDTSVTIKLEVTDETLSKVFPSDPPVDGALFVTLYCPLNHYRKGFVIEDSRLEAGEYQRTLEIPREMLRGRMELEPLLLRTDALSAQEGNQSGAPYAEEPGHKLAHGPKATVEIDDPEGNRSNNLDTIPKSFSEDPGPADDGNMWYLDLSEPSSPKLFVNKDHGYLVKHLKNKGQSGEGRVRQLVVDLFGTQIMTQFVLKAAELYAVDGEMKYTWQEEMLTEVCEDLFGDASPEEVEKMLEPGSISDNLNLIATTVQRRRSPHESLERVLELKL